MATFRHKTIRRFSMGGFHFKDYRLIVRDDEQAEKFREMVRKAPIRDQVDIVEINEEAEKALEKSIGPRVIRGASDTGKVNQPSREPATEKAIALEEPVLKVNPEEDPDKQKSAPVRPSFPVKS